MNENKIKNNSFLRDPNKNDLFFRQFLGARKETILRFKHLYQEDYFGDKERMRKKDEMYPQEFNRLKKYFDIDNGGNVLDIGCGRGEFLSLFPDQWRKYGIEISNYARKEANKRGVITDFELKDDFFDLIILRGMLQHLPDPVYRIGECYYWLKKGGGIVFLATPNTNSVYYKLFNTLPMLSECRNFLLPSDKMLEQILVNFGFKVKGFEYPYKNTPYASPVKDTFYFLLKFLRIKKDIKFAFYKNMMECYAEKQNDELN